MPAVVTQHLAVIADLDSGPANTAMVAAIAMFSDANKDTYLRRASGIVLAAYAKRMHRDPGSSFRLATWGDFTIDLTVNIARHMMLADRGYNPTNPADKAIRARYDDAIKILDEIVDLDNKTPRIDPDAVGTLDVDDEGPLGFSEGGCRDEADGFTHSQNPNPNLMGILQ
jgi:hypothetical protein